MSTGRVGAPPQDVDLRLVNWEEGSYTVTDRQGPRGETVIGGGHVAKEYYGMPEKTNEEFFTENKTCTFGVFWGRKPVPRKFSLILGKN